MTPEALHDLQTALPLDWYVRYDAKRRTTEFRYMRIPRTDVHFVEVLDALDPEMHAHLLREAVHQCHAFSEREEATR